ncbi:MAG: hypothetical protein KGJ86_09660, partial [Chloroflexota bacterium]|nr:hypothetical protein [Chloroflexota bacterium]
PDGSHRITVGMARHGRSATTLTLSSSLSQHTEIIERAGQFGSDLGCSAEAEATPDGDVLLRVSGSKLIQLMHAGEPQLSGERLRLLPVGVIGNGELLDVNWRELSHVLVAGEPGGGAHTVLSSLMGVLAAHARPEQLQLLTIAGAQALPDRLAELPHQRAGFVDAADASAVRRALETVREEVVARMRRGEGDGAARPPELVVVLAELGSLHDQGTSLELIASTGPDVGVRLLAAVTRMGEVEDAVLRHFGTRLVLRTTSEDESMRLVGQPNAYLLDAGGDMLVRVEGRRPVAARGYRLSAERLDELVHLMEEAYRPASSGRVEEPNSGGNVVAEEVRPPEPDLDGPLAEAVVQGDLTAGEAAPGPGMQLRLEMATAPESTEVTTQEVGSRPSLGSVMDRVRAEVNEQVEEKRSLVEGEGVLPRRAGVEVIEPAAARLQVFCLGGLHVTAGGRELSWIGSDGYNLNKPRELLAFLAVQRPEPVTNEQMVAALWPTGGDEQGVKNLGSALAKLRGQLDGQVSDLELGGILRSRDGAARLDGRVVWSDAQQFLELCWQARHSPPATARTACEQARALYRGELLAGIAYKWVHERGRHALTPAEDYREEYRAVTLRLGGLYCDEGQPQLAVTVYRALLEAEPTLEDVAQQLYRCYQRMGDRGAIVKEHHKLKDNLRQALYDPSDPDDDPDLYEPSAETVAVYAEVLADLDNPARPASAG